MLSSARVQPRVKRRFAVNVIRHDNPHRSLAAFVLTTSGDLYKAARIAAPNGCPVHIEEFGRLLYRVTPAQAEALASDDAEARKAAVTEIRRWIYRP